MNPENAGLVCTVGGSRQAILDPLEARRWDAGVSGSWRSIPA
jgi:hypothetical protein